MNKEHKTAAEKRVLKLEESVTTVTLLNTMFMALPKGVHPYFQVQLSAIAQALAEIAHCPHRLDSAHRLEQLVTEMAAMIGQPYLQEPAQGAAEPEAVNEADPSVTTQEQYQKEVLKAFFPNNFKE